MSDKNTELVTTEIDTMEGEFKQTRAFLRAAMAGVVTGEVNHQKAKDIALLAQQQNYNMAMEATLFPKEARGLPSSELIAQANKLAEFSDNERIW